MNKWLTQTLSERPILSLIFTLLTGAGGGQIASQIDLPDLADTHNHAVQSCPDHSTEMRELSMRIDKVLDRAIIPVER